MVINPQKLKRLMAEKLITIAELARLSDVSACTLNMVLNHGRNANIKTIGKICKALGVKPEEIIA